MTLITSLLREAAEIMNDPAGRSPEDVALVAGRLVEFAERTEAWEIDGMLDIEAEPIVPTSQPRSRREASELFQQYEAQARRRHAAYRIMAEFLRLSGFANDTTREETSR